MKAQAYFTKLKSQAKIENEDFNKFIEGLADNIEIPDVAVNLLEDSFLTRDRATSDFKIINKIKAEALNGVDATLKNIIPILDSKDQEEIGKEPNTYRKIELLASAIPNILEKVKKDNPDANEQVKELKKQTQEYVDKIKAINAERENEKAELQKKFEAEKAGMKLDWTLERKFSEYEFGDEYKSLKSTLIKGIVDGIRTNNVLDLDDKGQIIVMDIDPVTKVTKQKFNGNDPVTIDSLLAEPVKPFLKKNTQGQGVSNGGNNGGQQRTIKPNDSNSDPNKMTLAQRRAAGVKTFG
jgi:hypothetical protein